MGATVTNMTLTRDQIHYLETYSLFIHVPPRQRSAAIAAHLFVAPNTVQVALWKAARTLGVVGHEAAWREWSRK